jgi:hypothetical protein
VISLSLRYHQLASLSIEFVAWFGEVKGTEIYCFMGEEIALKEDREESSNVNDLLELSRAWVRENYGVSAEGTSANKMIMVLEA